MNFSSPKHAVISLTSKCNSHCLMCDIWSHPHHDTLMPSDLTKLPTSLTDINLTGGEPFLRSDLIEIIKNIKNTCPNSRLVINTNGFLSKTIKKQVRDMILVDPKIAIRVSLDGYRSLHSQIRQTKYAWTKATKTISMLRPLVSDLGVSFTIMDKNIQDLPIIFKYCLKRDLQLSLTLVSSSPIYFGPNKINLRPQDISIFKKNMQIVIKHRLHSHNPKEWLRAYFDQGLIEYFENSHRPVACLAGTNSFYLDSQAKVYICHLQNWYLGNLKKDTFPTIWNRRKQYQNSVSNCQDCWMVCSFKPSLKKNLFTIINKILKLKFFYET